MTGSASIAEDVTQEVFLMIIQHGDRYDSRRGPFATYLYGIARNLVLQRLTRERPYVALEAAPDNGRRATGVARVRRSAARPHPQRVNRIASPRRRIAPATLPRSGDSVRSPRFELRRRCGRHGLRGGYRTVAASPRASPAGRPTARRAHCAGARVQFIEVLRVTCHSVDQSIDDIVRTPPAELAGPAADHSSCCARCAARVAEARDLAASLRLLAEADEHLEAPWHVETRLLDALEAEQRRRDTTVRVTRPALKHVALAASLLLALAALASWSLDLARDRPRHSAQVRRSAPDAATVGPQRDSRPSAGAQASRPERIDVLRSEPSAKVPTLSAGRSGVQRVRSGGRQLRALAPLPQAEREVVLATSFLPVVGSPELYAGETLHLIRVRLPRSSLPAFGVALDENRTTEMIDADVLLGDDGFARAIRFIQ